jgi:hypothetical protein
MPLIALRALMSSTYCLVLSIYYYLRRFNIFFYLRIQSFFTRAAITACRVVDLALLALASYYLSYSILQLI